MEEDTRPLSLFLSGLDHQVGQIVRIFSILESKQALHAYSYELDDEKGPVPASEGPGEEGRASE